jgi:hypothetical protein
MNEARSNHPANEGNRPANEEKRKAEEGPMAGHENKPTKGRSDREKNERATHDLG